MIDTAQRLGLPDVAYVLPEAAGGSWYPGRFSAPLASNQPWLDQSLQALEASIGLATSALPLERIVAVGFSQGACLIAELLARAPRRFASAAILTGALLGAPHELARPKPLGGVRMYVSSSRYDEWVPPEAVEDTARRFADAGACVTVEISEEHVHHISDREIAALRSLLERTRE